MHTLPLRYRCARWFRTTSAAPVPRYLPSPSVRRSPLLAALLLLLLSAPLFAQFPPNAETTSLSALASEETPGPTIDIPVAGVEPEELRDSFQASRSEGRTHLAIDIHAARGTPVLAAADGKIIRLHSGSRGGHSLYQLDQDGRTRYYYAHLDHYAEGLHEGQRVRRGEVIGYVGDTGNAAPGDYHLHFSVAVLHSVQRWWEGTNLNPYTLLRRRRPPTTFLASTSLPQVAPRLP